MTKFEIINRQVIATDEDGQRYNLNASSVLLHAAISKQKQDDDILLDRRLLLMRALSCCKTTEMEKGVKREVCAIDYLLNVNNSETPDI